MKDHPSSAGWTIKEDRKRIYGARVHFFDADRSVSACGKPTTSRRRLSRQEAESEYGPAAMCVHCVRCRGPQRLPILDAELEAILRSCAAGASPYPVPGARNLSQGQKRKRNAVALALRRCFLRGLIDVDNAITPRGFLALDVANFQRRSKPCRQQHG